MNIWDRGSIQAEEQGRSMPYPLEKGRGSNYLTLRGELELYRYKTRFRGYDPVLRRRIIPEKDLESVKTIQRKGNNGILLLNSINAIHGVTPRNPTPHMRCYFRFNAYTDKPLFEEKDYLTWSDRIKYKVRTTVRM
jgi:hypothetical protein